MSTLETVLLIMLVVDAVALGVLVLIQQGRGADVGAAFGSGSANTMFGSGGSTSFLTKTTVWLALGFFVISFGLAYTAKERASTLDTLGVPQVPVSQAPSGSVAEEGADVPVADAAGSDVPTEQVPTLDGSVSAGSGGGSAGGGESDAETSSADRLTRQPERVDSDIPDV
jgi:preprotein translocase subunit SecG